MKLWIKILSVFFIFSLIFLPKIIFAHPGRTASDGCHYCRTNCAKWGEVENVRHCHGGGSVPQPLVEKVLPPPTTIPTRISTRVPTRRPTVIPTIRPSSTPIPTSTLIPTNEPTIVVAETPTSIPIPTIQSNTLDFSSTANTKVVQNKNIFTRFFSWLFRKNY